MLAKSWPNLNSKLRRLIGQPPANDSGAHVVIERRQGLEPSMTGAVGVNFYRDTFCSAKNRELVTLAQKGDQLAILKHLMDQDFAAGDFRYDDESFDNRYGMQAVFDAIRNMEGHLTILDVACGNADLLRRLGTLGHAVTGIDLSPIRVLQNQAELPELYLASAENIPLASDSFDVIIAQECLEHVVDLDRSLREIFRLLKPSGLVFCQVPDGEYADGDNHLRLFDIETLRRAFKITGFETLSVELIPYLVGGEPRNISLVATKLTEVTGHVVNSLGDGSRLSGGDET